MTEWTLPARYAWAANLDPQPAGPAYRVLDRAHGDRPCRLVLAQAEPACALALRQAHAAHERLAHPALAAALALDTTPDGRWYAVQEALAPVADTTPDRLLALLPDWLAGLAHLHQAGWVHGALGPDALGLAADGRGKLQQPGRCWRVGQSVALDGPVAFAAPELLAGSRLDGRCDLYMLGALCLDWLAGRTPDEGWDDLGLGDRWDALLCGLLAPVVSRRFAGAEAAAAVLAGSAEATSAATVTPFVGRRDELERLLSLADEAADEGTCKPIALVGEAGVGVSRLMEEFRYRLRFRGFVVLSARAGALVDGRPLAAWIPLVGALYARAPQALRDELGPLLAALLGPTTAMPAAALEPQAERMRLFRAIASLIEDAARPSGLGLFLDDWQLADPASRDLLGYLEQAMPAVPLCLVLGGHEPPAGGREHLKLERFDQDDMAAVCRGVWRGETPTGGPEGDGGWLAALESATGGHPALVEAVASAALQPGASTATAVAQLATAPRTLAALHTARLAPASPAARMLAAAAAIAGPGAPLPLLQGITALADEPFLAALDELACAGVLVPDARGYGLTLPAAPALALAPADWAQAGHGRALGYWRLAAQLGQAVPVGRLAHHAIAADDAPGAAYYALQAAREALGIFALAEAGALLTHGERCLQALDGAPAAWQLDYTIARADLGRFAGRGAEAEGLYRTAIALAAENAPERLGELGVSLGIALNLQSRSVEAEAAYREALAGAASASPLFARATNALARLCVRLGRAEEAEALCREVIALEDAPALYRGEALGLVGLILTSVRPSGASEGLAFLAEALTLAEATGDRLALNNACMLTGNARMALGQLASARASFERYALLCQELGLADEVACASLNLAQVAFEEGQFQESYQRALAGTAAAARAGNQIYEAFGQGYIALAGCQLGHLLEAERALAEGLAIAQALNNAYMGLQLRLIQIETQVFLGRLGRAEELGLEFGRLQAESGVQDFAGAHALVMGQLYLLAGETASALGYLQQAHAAAETLGRATLAANARLELGLLALQAGQLALAQDRALEALDHGERCGARLPQLRATMLLARVNELLGYERMARAYLESAEELAEGLGSPHWQALVWKIGARLRPDSPGLQNKASAFLHFYLQQLPPRARQEFLNWPERRAAWQGRPTGPLDGPVLESLVTSAIERPTPMARPSAAQGGA